MKDVFRSCWEPLSKAPIDSIQVNGAPRPWTLRRPGQRVHGTPHLQPLKGHDAIERERPDAAGPGVAAKNGPTVRRLRPDLLDSNPVEFEEPDSRRRPGPGTVPVPPAGRGGRPQPARISTSACGASTWTRPARSKTRPARARFASIPDIDLARIIDPATCLLVQRESPQPSGGPPARPAGYSRSDVAPFTRQRSTSGLPCRGPG